MDQDFNRNKGKTLIAPIQWCFYIVKVGYATAALIILAHVIWYYAARSVLAFPPDIYLRNYIILPAIGLFAVTFFVDRLVRAPYPSLFLKEYLSLALFIVFSFYLCITHDIAKVLLGSFTLPIFSSALFADVRLTRRMFWLSCLAVLVLGVQLYLSEKLDSSMSMQIFVACFMYLCSFLLAKVLIRYGHDNLSALAYFDAQQRYMQEQLKLDPFTGLFNRKTFDTVLAKLIEECSTANKYLTLAMIDVDHFKSINDFYGHAVGDRVLLYLSQILKTVQAENINVFRMGGEEFAILFRDCDVEEAYRICEEIRGRMESASLNDIDKQTVTFSCGLVCKSPKNPDLAQLTEEADLALYAAKNNGRNQVMIYNQSMQYSNQN